MANYFTYFSLVLPLKPDQRDYALQLAAQVAAHRDEDQPFPESFPSDLGEVIEDWWFETDSQDEGIWLHSDNGGTDAACVLIQHLLQKFEFAPSVGFEWSHDCSQPRTDAYGGGAAFITATKIETMSTTEWLRSQSV